MHVARATRRTLALFSTVAAFALATAPVAMAQATLRLDYKADAIDVVSGGVDVGGETVDLATVGLDVDLERAIGWAGASASITIVRSNGQTVSDRAGARQPLSSIEVGDDATRLTEAWVEAPLGPVSVRAGVMDLNAEFDASEPRGLFLHSSQGIGPEFSGSGAAGPSIFPNMGLGLRAKYKAGDWTLAAAAFDGRPGDPNDHRAFTSFRLGGDEGALLVAEAKRAPEAGLTLALGGWAYTASFDALPTSSTSPAARGDGDGGLYGSVESAIAAPQGKLRGFLRLGASRERYNGTSNYLGAGLVWSGALSVRPDDLVGVGVASAGLSDGGRYAVSQDGPAATRETAIEFSYSAQLTTWASLQPMVTYVVNPGGRRDIDDAVAVGVRLHLATTFAFGAKPKADS